MVNIEEFMVLEMHENHEMYVDQLKFLSMSICSVNTSNAKNDKLKVSKGSQSKQFFFCHHTSGMHQNESK